MRVAIRLRDDNGRIIGTARREADKTLPEIFSDILKAVGLVWIAVELSELLTALVLFWL